MKPPKKPSSSVTTGEGQVTTHYEDSNKPVCEVVKKPNGQVIIRKPGK